MFLLNKSQLVNFIATSRSKEAKEFYANILRLTFVSDDEFALVFEVNNTILRIQKVADVRPHPYTVLGFAVKDIRKEVAELSEKGVRCIRYPGMNQDDAGIWLSSSRAKVAWFADPDGNILSLTELSKE